MKPLTQVDLQQYELFLFDFDGTLVASQQAITQCLVKTFQSFSKKPPSEENIAEVLGEATGIQNAIKSLAPELLEHVDFSFEQWLTAYKKQYDQVGLQQTTLFPGVDTWLKQLSERSAHILIVSNAPKEKIEALLKKFKLDTYVEWVIGARLNGYHKPDPKLFYEEIKPYYSEIPLDKMIMIGDSVTDLQFAHNIGIAKCWVSYGYGAKDRCLALKPEYVIDHCPADFVKTIF